MTGFAGSLPDSIRRRSGGGGGGGGGGGTEDGFPGPFSGGKVYWKESSSGGGLDSLVGSTRFVFDGAGVEGWLPWPSTSVLAIVTAANADAAAPRRFQPILRRLVSSRT
ncbi:hypothetical protein [Amycolatopsis vancoresmycina]|uniref:hypothetical protein n=1 Tax=Amycolatopsis vancoresmycina TaxID=208444 RepID=UPI0012DF8E60|nr:hypothetical protein [Amycolatopsis vancoresmycina]